MAKLSQQYGFVYTLILTDFNMPVMDGLETTAILREILGNDIPIVGITGYASNKYHKIGKEAGMTEVVSKPVYVTVLRQLLQKYYFKSKQQF